MATSSFKRFAPSGSLLPFSDPPAYQGVYSPYFNDTHHALREEVKQFVDEFIVPYVDEWDAKGEIDPQLYKEFGKRGYLVPLAGQTRWPSEYTDVRIKSVPPEKLDAFHEVIIVDEIARAGSGGVLWFLMGGYNISAPAIFNYASEEVKRRVLPDILSGKKRSCLAITEPDAGSDVANLTTTAEKSKDGSHFIVNGTKKWITNGIFADYFVVATRTGGPGMAGVTIMLAERHPDTVSTRKIITQGMLGSGTTLLNFEDCVVPAGNILGGENQGFRAIMSNFNHERLIIIAQAVRMARVVLEDAMKWAVERETFGTKLIDHPVIRQKFGIMGGRIEGAQAWLFDLVYQSEHLSKKDALLHLGGPIAACKVLASQCLELCAREASQIFGGLSYTKGGKAGRVERIYREVRAYAIPGGSEEIMLDLAVRQALKTSKALGAKL